MLISSSRKCFDQGFPSFCYFHTSGRTANGNQQLTVKQSKPINQRASTHTYLLTTATGKLKAGTSVLSLAMQSALQEIKS